MAGNKMEVIFLGTGTSTGVPVLRCNCRTCRSTDSRDKRLRASVLICTSVGNLIIDTGPDFRTQLLRENSPALDAALITHIHYDHVGGIDDLRPYCWDKPNHHFPVYCRDDVAAGLRHNFPYSFEEHPYPGVPVFDLHNVDEKPFVIKTDKGEIEVTPLPVMHGKLPILGYRIGKLAYVTDCSFMPESTRNLIKGVDTLIVNALRPQHHNTHMSIPEALELIRELKPRVAYLTHMSHDTPPHAEAQALLPDNVFFAYDGLKITVE